MAWQQWFRRWSKHRRRKGRDHGSHSPSTFRPHRYVVISLFLQPQHFTTDGLPWREWHMYICSWNEIIQGLAFPRDISFSTPLTFVDMLTPSEASHFLVGMICHICLPCNPESRCMCKNINSCKQASYIEHQYRYFSANGHRVLPSSFSLDGTAPSPPIPATAASCSVSHLNAEQ